MRMRKICVVFPYLLAMLFVLDACSNGQDTSAPVAAETEKKAVTEATSSETNEEEMTASPKVEYREDQAYLITADHKEYGPFRYLDDKSTDRLIRYLPSDESGLFGYIDRENGQRITDAVFSEAGRYDTYADINYVRVRQDGCIYYLNKEGQKTFSTSSYIDGSEPVIQSSMASVQSMDGSWSLILIPSGKVLLDGCAKISPISATVLRLTAVKDDHLFLYEIHVEDPHLSIIKEYEDLADADEIENSCFLIVTNTEGKKGVIDLTDGELLILCNYDKITYQPISYDEEFGTITYQVIGTNLKDNRIDTFIIQ